MRGACGVFIDDRNGDFFGGPEAETPGSQGRGPEFNP